MLFGWVEVIAVIASGMRPTPCLLAHVAGFSLGNESPSLPGEIYTPLVFHLPEASVFFNIFSFLLSQGNINLYRFIINSLVTCLAAQNFLLLLVKEDLPVLEISGTSITLG